MKTLTVNTHPRWLTAQAKLNELSREASKLRVRSGELAAIIAASPSSQSASIEALELLGDAIDGGHVAALQAGKSARVELAENRKRLAVLTEAVEVQQSRMNSNTGSGNSLASELGVECCRTAGPEFIRRMKAVLVAAQALKTALEFADEIPQTLTLGGGGYVSDPICLEYGPFPDITYKNSNTMINWIEQLNEYINTHDTAAKAALSTVTDDSVPITIRFSLVSGCNLK